MSFSFGTPKTATGFTLPTTATPSVTAATGGSGDNKQTKPAANLFGTPTSAPGFSLSSTPKTTAPTLTLGLGATSTPASTQSFSFAGTAPTAATTSQFSLGANTTATTAGGSTLFGLPTSAATSAALKLTTSLTPASTAASSSSLGLGGLTAPTSQALATVAPTTTATSSVSTPGGLTFAQLEDSINKWTIDLNEQGKFFINQTKQLNAWDHLLVSNSDKIVQLNDTIERIKQKQKQLDQELDFVLAQQNELDELSVLLEKQLADIPITDQSRFQTYQLSEIIDSQLKQMSEDLKEIVEHLNETNKEEDISDPMLQITRILNAHMNSLQWIDRNTTQISSHLEQVSQLHETYKKNNMNM